MRNAATAKIHELKTDVISIQARTSALLPGDAPHLLVKDTRCEFVGQAWVRLRVCSLLVGVPPIDRISARRLPKPRAKNEATHGSAAIRLKSEQAAGDSFHLNRESGVSYPFLLRRSGV